MLSTRCQSWTRLLFAVDKSAVKSAMNVAAMGLCTSAAGNSHYASLGIPQSSTQNEIKAAYYKMSKIYHPDKNQGSEWAANKFREITQAYEVLGNYRLRRLYDKGIIHTAGSQYAKRPDVTAHHAPEVHDDPETKFYKSRFTKSTVTDSSGRTPIYDFDEWSRAHYGTSFQRRKNAKEKYERKQTQKRDFEMSVQNEVVIFGIAFCATLVYIMYLAESAHDTPQQQRRNAEEASKQR